jgi:response regulator of citrate/malate metabolism
MDSEKKNPESMTSTELANALKSGTVGGGKPEKSKTKIAAVKPKAVKKTSKPKAAAKTSKPAKTERRFGVESVVTIEKLSALLKKKPHTAADLAKIFKRSTIAVKRQVAKVKGVKLSLRAANGKIGRRPNVYSLA